MAKDKLFSPEDFDKDPKKNYRNVIQWVIGCVVLVLVALAILFGFRRCNSDNTIQTQEQTVPVPYVDNDSVDSINEVGLEKNAQPGLNESLKEKEGEVVAVEENSNPTIIENPPIPISSDIEKEAFKVIRGEYGNNPIRKNKLGDGYQNIQNRVNELKREGAF